MFKSISQGISKDFFLTLLTRVASLVGGIGTSIVTARFLGPNGRGEYFFVITIAGLIAQFGNFGLQTTSTYLVAKKPALLPILLANILLVSIVIGGGIGLLVGVFLLFFSNIVFFSWGYTLALIFLASTSIFYMLGGNLLVGLHQIRTYNVIQILSAVVITICLLGAGIVFHQPLESLLAASIGWICVCVYLFYCLYSRSGSKINTDFSVLKPHVRYSLKIYITTFLGYLVLRSSVFLLNYFRGAVEVGFFSIAAQVNDVIAILPTTMAFLLFPKLLQNPCDQWYQMFRALKSMAILIFGICLAAYFFMPFVVPIMFGQRFTPAISAIDAILPSSFFYALISILSQYLTAVGFPISQLVAWIIALCILIVSNIFLIPTFGSVGASVSLSISYAFLFVYLFILARGNEKMKDVAAGRVQVISINSLSTNFKQIIEKKLNMSNLEYITFAQLKKVSLSNLIRTLRSYEIKRTIIAFEDDASYALREALSVWMLFTRSPERFYITPDYQMQVVRKIGCISSFLHFIFRTLSNYSYHLFAYLRMYILLRRPLVKKKFIHNPVMVYLNANIWFGLKAGGSVGHVAGVINALLRKGKKVHYLAIDRNVCLGPAAIFHALPSLAGFGYPLELNYYPYSKKIESTMIQTIKQLNPSVIYQRMSLANYSAVPVSLKYKIPLIIEYNGSEVWGAKHWGASLRYSKLAKMAEELCLKKADFIVTVSEVLKQELIQRGIERSKIIMYPNCIDEEIFNPEKYSSTDIQALRKRYGFSDSDCILTFIGTFGNWHGVDVLARVIADFIRQEKNWLVEHHVRFLLVGDGALMPVIRQILDGLLDDIYVVLTGVVPQNEAPLYLAASDVFLSPQIPNPDGSPFFGSPTKLFEYMAMGRGIIASDLNQIGEILKDSFNLQTLPTSPPSDADTQLALLCEPGNQNDLKLAIKFMVENPGWARKMGKNARLRVLERYTWRHHVERILSELNKIECE